MTLSVRDRRSGERFDLCEIGAEVVVIGALLALGESITEFAAKHGVALKLLKRMPHNLWQPAECPLCAAGIALE
jgi:orotate phosphoribosyltransferase